MIALVVLFVSPTLYGEKLDKMKKEKRKKKATGKYIWLIKRICFLTFRIVQQREYYLNSSFTKMSNISRDVGEKNIGRNVSLNAKRGCRTTPKKKTIRPQNHVHHV